MFSQCERNSAHNVEDKCKRRRLMWSTKSVPLSKWVNPVILEIYLSLRITQRSNMHSKHLWHNTLIISLEYHFKLTNCYFGAKSNLRLSCPSKNFRFQNFLVIIWHLSWHFVLFLNAKHCFHWYWNIFVTQPFILWEKSAES